MRYVTETSVRSSIRTDRRVSAVGRRLGGGAHYGRLGSPGTMNTGQRLRGPRRRQRIAAISAIHVALDTLAASMRRLQPGSTKIRHRFNRLIINKQLNRVPIHIRNPNPVGCGIAGPVAVVVLRPVSV